VNLSAHTAPIIQPLTVFQISPNAYYNCLKQRKAAYQQQKNQIKEEIKHIYYNNNRLPGPTS
jgi:hypothetical protein